jgi:Uncharacterized protein conserved in bacteria
MKKKIIIAVLLISIFSSVLLTGIISANAAALNNRTSFSVGTDYKKNIFDIFQINTTGDAEYAFNTYKAMGWLSTVSTAPTKSYMQGKHSNGYYRLESSILFFSGHGNNDSMGWNYQGKGGNYAVDITTGTGNYNYSNGTLGIGLGQFRSSQNDLVVFAGCETAKGTNNISRYVVDRGAKTSIGWTVSIGAGSHTNWLKRFNDKLKTNNSTIQAAATHASGYTYVDNGVKNYKIYGDKHQIPLHNFLIAMMMNNNTTVQENQYVINSEITISKNLSTEENMKASINAIISNNISSKFNSYDYKIEVNGTDEIIYDYVLYVNGVRTDLGYSVITKDNKILSIYDNTRNLNIGDTKDAINNSISQKDISANKLASMTSTALAKVEKEYADFNSIIENEITYFDTISNKLYQVTLIKIENSRGQISIIEHYDEIK